jgi:hypothetical protein
MMFVQTTPMRSIDGMIKVVPTDNRSDRTALASGDESAQSLLVVLYDRLTRKQL